MSTLTEYLRNLERLLEQVRSESVDSLEKAAQAVAGCIAQGGFMHVS